jgi:mRNA-degrading endonuclease RelE of RelBE toxin-antitoxin system
MPHGTSGLLWAAPVVRSTFSARHARTTPAAGTRTWSEERRAEGRAGVDNRECICNYTCVYRVRFARSVEKDLLDIRALDRSRILKLIQRQLFFEPCVETRNRKILPNLIPPFEADPPVWELRIGEYRVFYDVDEPEGAVYVRAVRKKPPHKTTEEIL